MPVGGASVQSSVGSSCDIADIPGDRVYYKNAEEWAGESSDTAVSKE
jgi:hypothetical protein